MRKIILFFVVVIVSLSSAAQRIQREQFALSDVRLLPSRIRDNFKRDSMWMMSIPVHKLLHSFRNTSGTFSALEGGYDAFPKLGGWESLDCDLRGHTTGHLMSALAFLYAQTGSPVVKAKADSIVDGLAEVQQMYDTGYLSAFGEGLINRNIQGKSVWAPWYTLHKIAQGLIDQYQFCHNAQALVVVRGMMNWAYNKLKTLPEKTRRLMLRNEFGGFNDAMLQLHSITNDDKALWLARFFYHNDKIDPFKNNDFDLGSGHANTLIPKVLGEARNYEMFGDESSRRAAIGLFETLAYKHAFVTGEVSDKEHLFKPETMHQHLTGYNGENCCTYNLLKLASHVYSWTGNTKVMDYYERASYNHILGQQDPETGMVSYFTPLMTGAYRLYSTRDSSYWCCVGSGFESHVKYASNIYSHHGDTLFVNLFIPSQINYENSTVTMTTDFPKSSRVQLTVSGEKHWKKNIFRNPAWATAMKVRRNGNRYVVDFRMSDRYETVKGDSSRVALLRGPIVMAGVLGKVEEPFSNPKKHNDYYTFDYKVPENIKRVFLKDMKKYEVKPFYDVHYARYAVYWEK